MEVGMTDSASVWRKLRLKTDPTADDHDWRANLVTPNRITAVVGGTTTAGVYSIRVVGKVWKPGQNQLGTIDVDFTATMTRVAETDAQIADALEDDFDAGTIRADSAVSLSSVGITADVSSATITILAPPNSQLTFTATAPGSATITFPIGSTLPITASAPHYGRNGADSVNGIIVVLNQMDDAGATLLAPGTSTINLEAVELIELEATDSRGDRTYVYRTVSLPMLTDVTFGTPIEIPLRGAKFWTVRLTTDTALDGNCDSIEVLYRDGVT
jgi:hypothetical protein